MLKIPSDLTSVPIRFLKNYLNIEKVTINGKSFLENRVIDISNPSIEIIGSFMFEGTNVQKVIWPEKFFNNHRIVCF
jgi:hypothetical protein